MNALPVTFIFSPLGWVDPVTASAEMRTAFDQGEEASVVASLHAALEGFQEENIRLPDLRATLPSFFTKGATPLHRDWLCALIQEMDPFQWSMGMQAVDPTTLSGVRFASPEAMLAHVRTNLKNGHPAGDTTVTLDVSRSNGEKRVTCELPPSVLESQTTVAWLSAAIRGTKDHFPDIKKLCFVFPLNGIHLDYPLHDTWGLVAQFSPDILPKGDEIHVTFQLSPEVKVVWGFFRGERELRKVYYDANGEKWEVLELKIDQKSFELLVRQRGGEKEAVEIHVDPHLAPYTRHSLFEIFGEALRVVTQRQGLKEVMLVIETIRDPHQIDATAEVLVQNSFEGIPGFEGKVTLAAVLPDAVYYYPFERRLPNRMIRTGNMFFTTRRDFPVPPHLYLPIEPEADDATLIGVAMETPSANVHTGLTGRMTRILRKDLRDLLGLPKK